MDLYDFVHLNQERREALIWEKGTFLAVRYSGGVTICLYHLKGFYAEVVYLQGSNEIMLVRRFKSKAWLEPYLEMVDLSEIKF